MNANSATLEPELAEWRGQVKYWPAEGVRADERALFWKRQAQTLGEQVRKLEETVGLQKTRLAEQEKQIEALKARVVLLQQQAFGSQSERGTVSDGALGEPAGPAPSEAAAEAKPRKKGQQRGAQGHGRRRRNELPTEFVDCKLPAAQRRCPACGVPCIEFPDTEDSEEIQWEVRVFRRIYRRKRYRTVCDCGELPGILAAPPPPKLIPKGLFSAGFWVHLLLEKYLLQRPLHRVRQRLALEGLFVSAGTLTGGLKRIGELLEPLYVAILERSRQSTHWFMDETRWMVFVELAGKTGFKWWLWVVVTKDTCAFLLDPSRSSRVPREHLGDQAEGVINADRYSAYKALGPWIQIAFCWVHVRRDYLRIRAGFPALGPWAKAWVLKINELFRLNRTRLKVLKDPAAFAEADGVLREAHAAMAARRDAELADPRLHPAQRKALKSLKAHWKGLSIFLDRPEIPMDNNTSERAARNAVIGRKNYYGSGSVWSGRLTVALFTVFQTLLLNQLDPQKFLLAYFEACARNDGKPPVDPGAFLPWNLTEEQQAEWRLPGQPSTAGQAGTRAPP